MWGHEAHTQLPGHTSEPQITPFLGGMKLTPNHQDVQVNQNHFLLRLTLELQCRYCLKRTRRSCSQRQLSSLLQPTPHIFWLSYQRGSRDSTGILDGPALLRRDWLCHLKLDWKTIGLSCLNHGHARVEVLLKHDDLGAMGNFKIWETSRFGRLQGLLEAKGKH